MRKDILKFTDRNKLELAINILYWLEDKRGYRNKKLGKIIDKLQGLRIYNL